MVYTNLKKKLKTYQQENKQAIKQKTGRKNQQKKKLLGMNTINTSL